MKPGSPSTNPSKIQEEQYENLLRLLERENVQSPLDLKNLYEKLVKQAEATKTYDERGNPIIDDEGGCIITPRPAFIIKTKDKAGGKVFINMCEHELVDPIEEKPIPDSDEVGLRIPLSLGEAREDFDKKGGPCRVYDIIWNPKTVKKAVEEKGVRQIVVELALAHIKQKKGVALSDRYSLPKMKYKGKTVQLQRIKGKKAPKIEEIKVQEKVIQKAINETKNVVQTPEWKLFVELRDGPGIESYESLLKEMKEPNSKIIEPFDGFNANGKEAKSLVFQVSLPLLVHGHSIVLECSEEQLYMTVANFYELVLFLPCGVIKEDVKAYFDCSKRTLYVQMPVSEEADRVEKAKDVTTMSQDYLFDVI